MKKWWNNVRLVEAFLKGKQLPGKHPPRLTQGVAREAIRQQQLTYDAARWHGRQKLKRELQEINHDMLHEQQESKLVRAVRKLWGV